MNKGVVRRLPICAHPIAFIYLYSKTSTHIGFYIAITRGDGDHAFCKPEVREGTCCLSEGHVKHADIKENKPNLISGVKLKIHAAIVIAMRSLQEWPILNAY